MRDLGAAGNLTLVFKSNGETDMGSSMKTPCAPPPDLRGKWLLQIADPGQDLPKPKLLVFFTGAKNRGKLNVFADANRPEPGNGLASSGEYRVSPNLVVMKIAFGDELYYFNGNVDSANAISGNYSCDAGDPPRRHGTWTATRIE